MKHEIRIAGAGGQGVVTAGRILAEAALLSGLDATHSQVYGPQSRGGASRSDVVLSDSEIRFPLTDSLDVLVVLSPEAFERYGGAPVPLLIADEEAVPEGFSAGGSLAAPIVAASRRVSGGQIAAGVVALGTLQSVVAPVEAKALRDAVGARVPPRHREMNIEALEAGMGLAAGRVA